MTRTRNKLTLLTVTLCLLMAVSSIASAAIPSKWMDAFYVNDFADVVSTADQRTMLSLGEQLDSETGAQVLLVTTNFLDGMTAEDYGYQLYTTWGIGQEDDQNGVIILLAVGSRDIHITVGEDLDDKIPASVAGRYIDDYAIPYLEEGNEDYSTAMRELYEAVCDKVASIYGVSLGTAQQPSTVVSNDGAQYSYNNDYINNGNTSSGGFGGLMEIIIGIVVLIIIVAVVKGIFSSAGRNNGGSGCMGSNSGCGPGCLMGWMMGRGSRSGGGYSRPMAPPPRRNSGGFGGLFGGGSAPRRPSSGGRSTGSFGGGSGGGLFGGGSSGRSGGSSRPTGRPGGGGRTSGGGAGRKF